VKNPNDSLKAYYREIRSCLPGGFRQKNRILRQIRDNVAVFQADHPRAAAEEVRAHFGAPDQIAAACVDEMDTIKLLNALRVRRRMVTAVVAGILVALTMWGAYLGWAVHEYSQSIHGTYETYITTQESDIQ